MDHCNRLLQSEDHRLLFWIAALELVKTILDLKWHLAIAASSSCNNIETIFVIYEEISIPNFPMNDKGMTSP